MRFHGGTVDQNLRRRPVSARQRVVPIDPNVSSRPTHITVVKRLLRPVIGRRINLSPARFQVMNNATDHTPVVNARLAPCVRRQVRFYPGNVRIHALNASGKLIRCSVAHFFHCRLFEQIQSLFQNSFNGRCCVAAGSRVRCRSWPRGRRCTLPPALTTQRRGSTSKPFALSGRLMISITKSR